MLKQVFLRAAVVGFALSAAGIPASAQDDGQESIITAVGGLIGLTSKPRVEIDYRERAPLVLPPKMQLRQPQAPVAERNPAWPVDPDVEAARQAEAQSKIPILFTDARSGTRVLTKQEALRDRSAAQNAQGRPLDTCTTEGRNCNKWNPTEGGSIAAKDQLVAGQEPERGTLTDPPKGYRLATKTVKATNDGPRQAEDNSARGYFKQPKPKTDE